MPVRRRGPGQKALLRPMIEAQCRVLRLPPPVFEYRFHSDRKWRFDVAWIVPLPPLIGSDRHGPVYTVDNPAYLRLALEIEGIVFQRGSHQIGGRHVTATGFKGDLEKYAEAAVAGWHLIRQLPEHVRSGNALLYVERYLHAHHPKPTEARNVADPDRCQRST